MQLTELNFVLAPKVGVRKWPSSLSLSTQMMMTQAGPPAAHAFLDFVNASPTPFHAVHVAARRLEKSGFCKVISLLYSPPQL